MTDASQASSRALSANPGKARPATNNPCVFIISAPSGSGKTTLVDRLLKDLGGLRFSVSYTTRNPRGKEQNGREYYFVSRSEFEGMIGQDDLLEWAEVFGNYYGTARRFLDEARQHGEDLLLDIDVQGAAKVRKRLPKAVSIFILPPSRVEMEARLRKRGQDAEEVIAKRLRTNIDGDLLKRLLKLASKGVQKSRTVALTPPLVPSTRWNAKLVREIVRDAITNTGKYAPKPAGDGATTSTKSATMPPPRSSRCPCRFHSPSRRSRSCPIPAAAPRPAPPRRDGDGNHSPLLPRACHVAIEGERPRHPSDGVGPCARHCSWRWR